MNRLETVRAVYGVTQIVAADLIAHRILHQGSGSLVPGVLRVLGARHLAQALATSGRPPRAFHVIGGIVDGLHASSMVAAAAAGPRAAAIDGAVAATFAIAEFVKAARR